MDQQKIPVVYQNVNYQNLLSNNEHLLSLQQQKQPNKTTDNGNATGNKTGKKSKSISNLMAQAFSKKMTLTKGTKSFVVPSSSSSSNVEPTTSSNDADSSMNHAYASIYPEKKTTGNQKQHQPEQANKKDDDNNQPKSNYHNNNNKNNNNMKKNNILNDKKAKYTMLKNPTVILRDVKNSVAQRFKSKNNGCSNFEKFHNEVGTPASAKLYSPFNVFTDSVKTQFNSKLDDSESNNANPNVTPKRSVVGASKKNKLNQLRQKLIFDSPTGKLRESVDDVEQFQQDIHRINANICANQRKEESNIGLLQ